MLSSGVCEVFAADRGRVFRVAVCISGYGHVCCTLFLRNFGCSVCLVVYSIWVCLGCGASV